MSAVDSTSSAQQPSTTANTNTVTNASSSSDESEYFSFLKVSKSMGVGILVGILCLSVLLIVIIVVFNNMNDSAIDDLESKISNAGKFIVNQYPIVRPEDVSAKCDKDSDCISEGASSVCAGKGAGCCPVCQHGECRSGMVTENGCESHQYKCKKDSDCAVENVCGTGDKQKDGCCASCKDGVCSAGMVTEAGCQPVGSSHTSYGSGHSTRGRGGASFSHNTGVAAPFESGLSCQSHQDAYLKACFAAGDHSDNCCAVCVDGLSVAGTRGEDGICQTTVQQSGYTGMGQQPPNTYMISSTGPRVGVTMGNCTVEAMGGGLPMHSAFY